MVGGADRLWVDSMPPSYEQWLVLTVFRPFAVDVTPRSLGCRDSDRRLGHAHPV